MRKAVLFALLFFTLVWSGHARSEGQSTRRKLDRATGIQGYSCDQDYAWFYADGKLQRCTVSQETRFGEASIPKGSLIYLKPDGSLRAVQLAHSTRIHDVLCDGGGFLGPAEGSGVGFYPSGKLKVCYLSSSQEVQGVLCARGGILATLTGPDPEVTFYESGRLRSCRLSRSFNGQMKSTIWRQAEK